jgi:D-alanyl-D-alanine carboxypeptidase/D-alanyl-D-alanine-endopeptidase (penicillin-binding protein 4)
MFDQSTQGDHVLSPIMINDNLVDLTLTPGAVGAAATVTTRPVTTAYTVSSAVPTTAAGEPAAVTVTTRGGAITVAGSVPAGPPVLRTEPVADPQSFARTLFIEALGRAGVTVTAQATGPNPVDALPSADSYAATDRVALHRSLPFAENIELINKADLDAQADTLIMLIAVKNGRKTFDDGMALLAPFVRAAGVDPASMSLADGSGSSDADRFTPRTAGALLRHQATSPDFPAYLASLPALGADGPAPAPTTGRAAGTIAAKTGTMIADDPLNGRAVLRTSGTAGYLTSRSGRATVVAVYVMNTPIAEDADALAVLADVGAVVVALWDAT